MSDSVDRVFVHALNTVKRIPRTGSARPPPASRLKLYGLYKQSTEGDVEAVMKRPRGDGEETRADQEKWDAWDEHKGISKTEAKRNYITTLIETMHRYASHTTYSLPLSLLSHFLLSNPLTNPSDARELVSELEFVWDQIKSNSPDSSSSAKSYSHAKGPQSNASQLIYPVMSEHGARNPGGGDNQPLREVEPTSQLSSEGLEGPYETQEEEAEREEFVDAQDSQADDAQYDSPSAPQAPEQSQPRTFGREATALMAPIANYVKSRTTTQQQKPPEDANVKWQRRVESALIKMNAEMAALREQVEMQHDLSRRNSMIRSFTITRRGGGVLGWLFRSVLSTVSAVAKHLLIDASVIVVVALWMRYKGIPAERLEYTVAGWIQRLRSIAYVRRIEREVMMKKRECSFPVGAVAQSIPFHAVGGLRANG